MHPPLFSARQKTVKLNLDRENIRWKITAQSVVPKQEIEAKGRHTIDRQIHPPLCSRSQNMVKLNLDGRKALDER